MCLLIQFIFPNQSQLANRVKTEYEAALGSPLILDELERDVEFADKLTEQEKTDLAEFQSPLTQVRSPLLQMYLDHLVRDTNSTIARRGIFVDNFMSFSNTLFDDKSRAGTALAAASMQVRKDSLISMKQKGAKKFLLPLCDSHHYCILWIDTTNGTVTRIDSIRKYQNFINPTNRICQLFESVWNKSFNLLQPISPQQSNGIDCGIYAISNSRALLAGITMKQQGYVNGRNGQNEETTNAKRIEYGEVIRREILK